MFTFENFKEKIVGMPISHTWRGVGSTIFLELGALTPTTLKNGDPGDPDGETSIMLPWSWRIEKPRSILGGSWSTDRKIANMLTLLKGKSIVGAALFGRLPELDLTLSNGFHILSFMTAESQPDWAIICRPLGHSLCVKNGKLALESHDT